MFGFEAGVAVWAVPDRPRPTPSVRTAAAVAVGANALSLLVGLVITSG